MSTFDIQPSQDPSYDSLSHSSLKKPESGLRRVSYQPRGMVHVLLSAFLMAKPSQTQRGRNSSEANSLSTSQYLK